MEDNVKSWETVEGDAGQFDMNFGDTYTVHDTPFEFTTGQLSKLLNPKSLAAFHALGGLHGLELGLRTDLSFGLNIEKPVQDAHPTSPNDFAADANPTIRPEEVHQVERKRIYGQNRIPTKQTSFLSAILRSLGSSEVLAYLTITVATCLIAELHQIDLNGAQRITILAITAALVACGAMRHQVDQHRITCRELTVSAKVLRSGRTQVIDVQDVVVGDVLLIEPGDTISADGIFINGHGVKCDESHIMGEANALRKTAGLEVFAAFEAGGDLRSFDPFMVSGSKVLEGVGKMLVTAVGVHSVHGRAVLHSREKADAEFWRTTRDVNAWMRTGIAILRRWLLLWRQPDERAIQQDLEVKNVYARTAEMIMRGPGSCSSVLTEEDKRVISQRITWYRNGHMTFHPAIIPDGFLQADTKKALQKLVWDRLCVEYDTDGSHGIPITAMKALHQCDNQSLRSAFKDGERDPLRGLKDVGDNPTNAYDEGAVLRGSPMRSMLSGARWLSAEMRRYLASLGVLSTSLWPLQTSSASSSRKSPVDTGGRLVMAPFSLYNAANGIDENGNFLPKSQCTDLTIQGMMNNAGSLPPLRRADPESKKRLVELLQGLATVVETAVDDEAAVAQDTDYTKAAGRVLEAENVDVNLVHIVDSLLWARSVIEAARRYLSIRSEARGKRKPLNYKLSILDVLARVSLLLSFPTAHALPTQNNNSSSRPPPHLIEDWLGYIGHMIAPTIPLLVLLVGIAAFIRTWSRSRSLPRQLAPLPELAATIAVVYWAHELMVPSEEKHISWTLLASWLGLWANYVLRKCYLLTNPQLFFWLTLTGGLASLFLSSVVEFQSGHLKLKAGLEALPATVPLTTLISIFVGSIADSLQFVGNPGTMRSVGDDIEDVRPGIVDGRRRDGFEITPMIGQDVRTGGRSFEQAYRVGGQYGPYS